MCRDKVSTHSIPSDFIKILHLAGPAIATQLLQTCVLYADRIMLGHYSSTALAAMQIAGPIEWTLINVPASFAVGTFALVGYAKGANDISSARRHTTLAILIALLVGWLIVLVGFLTIPQLPKLFPQAAKESTELAAQYLYAGLFAAPFFCIGTAGFSVLSALGNTVTPLKIVAFVNVIHVLGNYLLIKGHWGFPMLGIRGAGISTAISYALEAILTLVVLTRTQKLSHSFASLRPFVWPLKGHDGKLALRALIRLATPALGERIIYHSGYMIFVWMIARLGEKAMAANQALVTIEAISFNCVEGFAIAAASLVAQSLGAKNSVQAYRLAWNSTFLTMLTLSTFGICFVLFRFQLPKLFTDRVDLQSMAAQALLVVAFAQPFMAIGVVLSQSLRGAGFTRESMLISLASGFFVRLITTWFVTTKSNLGITGIWIGSTADWIARSIVLIIVWFYKKHTLSFHEVRQAH